MLFAFKSYAWTILSEMGSSESLSLSLSLSLFLSRRFADCASWFSESSLASTAIENPHLLSVLLFVTVIASSRLVPWAGILQFRLSDGAYAYRVGRYCR